MLVELVGCTCAGKTTLARKMVEAGRELGADVQLSDDFLLSCIHLNWIKNEFLRRRVIELWALLVCLMYMRKYRAFYRYVVRSCRSAPGSWMYRVKLARVVLKKIGIHEIIRSRSTAQQLVLLDNEGILQAGHTLFVHAETEVPHAGDLTDFLSLAPLSDVIAYLRQPERLLIERTLKRGHNRISEKASHENIASFISQAVRMFEEIRCYTPLAERLLVIDGARNTLLTGEYDNNPPAVKTANIILAGLARNNFPVNNRFNTENAVDSNALENCLSANHRELA